MPRPKTIQPHQAAIIVAMRSSGERFAIIAKAVGLSTRTVRNWNYKRLMKAAGIL